MDFVLCAETFFLGADQDSRKPAAMPNIDGKTTLKPWAGLVAHTRRGVQTAYPAWKEKPFASPLCLTGGITDLS